MNSTSMTTQMDGVNRWGRWKSNSCLFPLSPWQFRIWIHVNLSTLLHHVDPLISCCVSRRHYDQRRNWQEKIRTLLLTPLFSFKWEQNKWAAYCYQLNPSTQPPWLLSHFHSYILYFLSPPWHWRPPNDFTHVGNTWQRQKAGGMARYDLQLCLGNLLHVDNELAGLSRWHAHTHILLSLALPMVVLCLCDVRICVRLEGIARLERVSEWEGEPGVRDESGWQVGLFLPSVSNHGAEAPPFLPLTAYLSVYVVFRICPSLPLRRQKPLFLSIQE